MSINKNLPMGDLVTIDNMVSIVLQYTKLNFQKGNIMWQIHAIMFIAKFQEEVLGKKNLFLWGEVAGLYTFRDGPRIGPWQVKCVALKECQVNPGMIKAEKNGKQAWVYPSELGKNFEILLLVAVAETAMKKKRRNLRIAA